MYEYAIPCTIFIKPQEGQSLPENFREQFVDDHGNFTYEKTRPAVAFEDDIEEQEVSDGSDNTLTLKLETPRPPYAWLNHLSATYPDLLIECEHHSIEGDPVFGRTVWFGGGHLYDRDVTLMSRERYTYFGWYVDVDEDEDSRSWYPEFEDDENREAVEEVRTAHETKDWVALMEGLFTARSQLQSFENPNLPEDTLRVAMVTVDASLAMLEALTKDPDFDIEPLTSQFAYCDDECQGDEPDEPATRERLLVFVGTQAVECAHLLSMAKHHEVARRVKELAPELQWRDGIPVAQEPKIHLTDLEVEVFALLPDIDEETHVDDLVELFENATEPVHPHLVRIVAHRVGYFLDGGNEPDEDGTSGEESERIVSAVREMAAEGASDKDDLFKAITRLQYEWFWGDMNTDAAEVTSIKEQASRIDDPAAADLVAEFVRWNILEPWEEFVGDGEFPDDEDYMESFREWKLAVGAFLSPVEVTAS